MIDIKNKSNCSGCHACSSICPKSCITMKEDNEGFRYPIVQQETCINCGLCEKVCPIINVRTKNAFAISQAYALNNKNDDIRLQSSSGGIFTLLAENIISQGGVVFGVALSDNCRIASHIAVENCQDLALLRGSKYLQSIIGESYAQAQTFLEQGRIVLFTGTPCQIEGLLSCLQKNYENLFCIDIICHGVPSPLVWGKYLDFHEQKYHSSVRTVSFRHKKYGWKNFSMQLLFNNKSEYLIPLDKDIFMQAFLKNICLRPSCHECSFKTQHRPSDITMADLWGSQRICSQLDDDKGTSAIFIHSPKGQDLFNSISNLCEYYSVDSNLVIQHNLPMLYSCTKHKNRNIFFQNIKTLPFDILVKKYVQDPFRKKIKNKSRHYIRTILNKFGILKYLKILIHSWHTLP